MYGEFDASSNDNAWWQQQDNEMQRREDEIELELVFDPLHDQRKQYETLRQLETL